MVSVLFNASVKSGLDGGEFVTPEIQYSTELICVDETCDGSKDTLGVKPETTVESAIKPNREVITEFHL
jgi:hypothetical protein